MLNKLSYSWYVLKEWIHQRISHRYVRYWQLIMRQILLLIHHLYQLHQTCILYAEQQKLIVKSSCITRVYHVFNERFNDDYNNTALRLNIIIKRRIRILLNHEVGKACWSSDRHVLLLSYNFKRILIFGLFHILPEYHHKHLIICSVELRCANHYNSPGTNPDGISKQFNDNIVGLGNYWVESQLRW